MNRVYTASGFLSHEPTWFYTTAPYQIVMPLPLSSQPSWVVRLASFADLKDNWNSYGAEAPSKLAIETANRIAGTLHESFLAPTRIAPSVVGGIGISIKNPEGRKVYLEVYNDATVYMMLSDDTDDDPVVFPVRTDTEKSRKSVVTDARQHLARR